MDQPGNLANVIGESWQRAIDVPGGFTAALHGQAGRLIEGEDLALVPNRAILELLDQARIGGCWFALSAVGATFTLLALRLRRQAKKIASFDPLGALNPLAIQSDLARAEPLLLRAKANVRRHALHEPVKPLSGMVCGNLNFNGQGSVPPNSQSNTRPR